MTVELVIVVPLVLTLILLIVQAALWAHANHVAQAAASQGLASVRVHGGTPAAGEASARRLLDRLGAGPLRVDTVEADRAADTAAVRVLGAVVPVIPLIELSVRAEARGAVEMIAPGVAGG
ncbi:TadE/TadG family type IV pilus assembly protein [Actinokineospora pegani]|uniref:TadE/TadG family type IV pilus assembly protein n=1 Tax=Actinokineospora pegani TaxID=2654637 RepID=UPI001F29C967|nr:TadE/TadG family type IV pilus assembly protein [Actinokineospora pegani]